MREEAGLGDISRKELRRINMAKKEEQKSQSAEDKVEVIFEILAAQKLDIEDLESSVGEMSFILNKIKGRMGL